MGEGDDALGAVLMKGFLYAISQQDELPSTILFYDGPAPILTCEDAPTLEDLEYHGSAGRGDSDLRHLPHSLRSDGKTSGWEL